MKVKNVDEIEIIEYKFEIGHEKSLNVICICRNVRMFRVREREKEKTSEKRNDDACWCFIWIKCQFGNPIIHFNCIFHSFNCKHCGLFARTTVFFSLSLSIFILSFVKWNIYSSFLFRWSFLFSETECVHRFQIYTNIHIYENEKTSDFQFNPIFL